MRDSTLGYEVTSGFIGKEFSLTRTASGQIKDMVAL
jgi:hypothetical protein